MIRSDLEAVLLILSYEQLRLLPYDDGVGVMSIGWGHRILPNDPPEFRREITRERANSTFVADLERHERGALAALGSAAATLTPLQVGAIVSLAFNIGVKAFADSRVVKAIQAGDLAAVPANMKLWNKGRVRGVLQVMPGLVIRREAEARLWQRRG